MEIRITPHALERMKKYHIPYNLIIDAIKNPDNILETYKQRKIYQKRLNGLTLRAIIEQRKGINILITCYKSRSDKI